MPSPRYEPNNEIENGLIYLTKIIGDTILEDFPNPVNMKQCMVGTHTIGGVTVRFIDDKRKSSYCTPWLRTITYSSRDINKFNQFDDLVELVVHECCHFVYIGHKKEYWKEYTKWVNAARQYVIQQCEENK